MDIRKRRRPLYSTATAAAAHLFSLRSLFFSFIFLLLFLTHLRFFPAGFRPARVVPAAFRLSSAASNSVRDVINATSSPIPELRIQARILQPDALLVFLGKGGGGVNHNILDLNYATQDIDCVYHRRLNYSGDAAERLAFHPALSADDHDDFRWMVRCPLPPANYSSAVGLEWHLGGSHGKAAEVAAAVPTWEWATYGAEVDGETAVVFVKGFNLRPDRKSDAKQFRCRYELTKGETPKRVITVPAISAAQEIIRCPLPEKVAARISQDGEVKVAVDRPRFHKTTPSVARLGSNKLAASGGYKYQLCGCTMVWNQAAALREWVTYHAWLGVERWFIYDNNSNDGLKEEIESLNGDNYNISRHNWPWIKSQEAGFSQCVLRARKECKWVAFFDVDEFYYFPSSRRSNGTSGGELRSLVADYSAEVGVGEIRTKCHNFGPSGLEGRPAQGVTVGYTCRLQRPERHKSVVRPEAVDDTLLNSVHHFRLRDGFGFRDVAEGRVVINHYKYQVWEVFKAKFSRRVSTYVADWRDDQNEGSRDRAPGLGKEAVQPSDWRRWYCEVWDTGLRDLVVANLADPDTGLLPWQISGSL